MTRLRLNSLPCALELPAIFLLGLLVRIAFIHLHPAIYGGDTLVRMMNPDRVFLAYQLPLLQLLIYLVNLASGDPLLVRYLVSLIGALAGVSFYLLTATLLDWPRARLASLFFIFNPFLLVHSIVPYQEILMLLFLCLGLYCMARPSSIRSSSGHALTRSALNGSVRPWTSRGFRGVQEIQGQSHFPSPLSKSMKEKLHSQSRIGWASLFLGLACLTRYEAWVITAAAGLCYARTRFNSRSLTGCLRMLASAMALFGWAPLLWILVHRGVSPLGTYVLEAPVTWERLLRIPYIVAMAFYHTGPVVGCLALLGLLTFWKQSLWKKPGIQMVLAATALLMVSLVFSAHGVGPDPQRYVTDREAHWFVLIVFWAAALGLSDLKPHWVQQVKTLHAQPWIASRSLRVIIFYAALILTVVVGAVQTDRYVRRLLSDQNLVLDYAVAQHLERNLPYGSKALVLAHPLPPDATEEFFDKVYSQGGTEALETARRQVAELNSGPLDYSRVVVNTRRGKHQILDGSKLVVNPSDATSFLSQNRVRLAAVYSNYPLREANSRHLLDYVKQRGRLQVTLADRGLQVSIYELAF